MKIIYGKLTIIPGTERQVLIGKRKNIEIKTVCKCGNIKYLNFSRLKNGTTKSCGCSHYEKITTHGHSYTGTYGSWKAMIQRCQNPNSKYFYHYGGRGIKICRRWKKFENFLADMGERQEGMTLDRINGNKGYSKENCRWATKKEQQNNRKTNVVILFKNKKYTKSQLCEKYNIHMSTFHKRIKNGWTLEESLLNPVNKKFANKRKKHAN